jgi:hypothetical protein
MPDKRDEAVSFLSGDPQGFPERNDLLFVIYSECEHGRASESQHVQTVVFSRSRPACQEQNSHQFQPSDLVNAGNPDIAIIALNAAKNNLARASEMSAESIALFVATNHDGLQIGQADQISQREDGLHACQK